MFAACLFPSIFGHQSCLASMRSRHCLTPENCPPFGRRASARFNDLPWTRVAVTSAKWIQIN